jgi:ComF family protein
MPSFWPSGRETPGERVQTDIDTYPGVWNTAVYSLSNRLQLVQINDRPVSSPTSFATRLGAAMFGLSNILVPPVCLSCRASLADHHALCPSCWRDIVFIRAPLCERMGIPLPFDTGGPSVSALALAEPPDYDRARAAAHYAGTARKLVHDFKYADRQEARVLLGNWLTATGHELLSDAHLILPVPMSRRRLFWRKFNQAAILAHELGRRSGVAVDTAALRRRRATKPQVGLTRAQRHTNMEGAFAVLKRRRAQIKGANILLIDDVITTGATVNACARALKRAGAARVDVLAVCMVAGDLSFTP